MVMEIEYMNRLINRDLPETEGYSAQCRCSPGTCGCSVERIDGNILKEYISLEEK